MIWAHTFFSVLLMDRSQDGTAIVLSDSGFTDRFTVTLTCFQLFHLINMAFLSCDFLGHLFLSSHITYSLYSREPPRSALNRTDGYNLDVFACSCCTCYPLSYIVLCILLRRKTTIYVCSDCSYMGTNRSAFKQTRNCGRPGLVARFSVRDAVHPLT